MYVVAGGAHSKILHILNAPSPLRAVGLNKNEGKGRSNTAFPTSTHPGVVQSFTNMLLLFLLLSVDVFCDVVDGVVLGAVVGMLKSC